MGNVQGDASRVIDATGLIVAPGFMDIHTPYLEERRAKLSDLARRPALKNDMEGDVMGRPHRRDRDDGEAAQVAMLQWDQTFVDDVHLNKNKPLQGRSVSDIAAEQGKSPVDAMLDPAIEEDLKTEFLMPGLLNDNDEAVGQIIKHPLCLSGASDGGAHTKLLTSGRYPPHFLAYWVRDKGLMTLEEAHWRLSTMLGWAIGIRDRGWLREGMPADIVVDDLDKLAVLPMEAATDLPNKDWRRVQKAAGYHDTLVNGRVTCEGQTGTGALPGKMLRSDEQGA